MNLWEADKCFLKEDAIIEANKCLSCKNPRCETGCPTSMRIRDFILEIKKDNLEKAYDIINECSSLPYICSVVCPHENQCVGHCVLANKNNPVNVGALERYVVENVNKKLIVEKVIDLKVLVIGAGPAGFAFAKEMAKKGANVEIFEATNHIGGVLAYGIPSYRLNPNVLLRMQQELKELNVKIIYNRKVNESEILKLKENYDIVYLSTGLPVGKKIGIPNENINGVYDALTYLKEVNLYTKFNEGSMPILNGSTIVIGAGNVAMDAARTAIRQGSKVYVVYRRSQAEAPATKHEIASALAEGVEFKFLYAPIEVIGTDYVEGLKVEKMILGEPDSSGRRRPVGTGEYEIIKCDNIIAAIGQNPEDIYNEKVLKTDYNYLVCNDYKTNVENIYAGGDIVLGAKTVVLACASARKLVVELLKNK